MSQTTTSHLTDAIDGALLPDDPAAVHAATTLLGRGTPAAVVRPGSVGEVAAAVTAAREHGLPLTVRAGGHSMAGASTASGGLLIDLRRLDHVEVDPGTSLVSIGGGACWGRVAEALAPHGLGLTAGDTAGVGVGGLTLGGGIGWMVRKHGLAIDNLVGAQVVTADGTLHETSATREPDLFWAVRGGGAGIGVVTRFDFRAHQVTDVVFGSVVYALDDIAALIRSWQHAQRGADERLTTTLTLMPARGDEPAMAMLRLCFAGPEPEVAETLHTLLEIGTVRSHEVSVRPYADVLDQAEHPRGMQVAIDNVLLPGLDEQAIDDVAELATTGTVVMLRALGGAFADVPRDATAFGHRDAEVMVVALRPSLGPDAPTLDGIHPWSELSARSLGSYLNFRSDLTRQVFTPEAARRLQRLKAEHDPTGLLGPLPGLGAAEPVGRPTAPRHG